jgi:hypothetical protein
MLARDAPVATAVPEDTVPTVGDLEHTAMDWIEQVWGALNQGLADFDHSAAVSDWNAFAANVLGNLMWGTAAFFTGGGAFVVSLAGIGLSTVAAASSVNSLGDFHNIARADHDKLLNALKQQAPTVIKDVHKLATERHWTSHHTYQVLMKRLLQPEFITTAGGIPSVNSPRIAAHVEHELLLRAGSSPSTDTLGWKHGNWWVEYEYRVDNAVLSWHDVAPFDQWRLKRESEDAMLLPIDTDVRKTRDRLNEIQPTLGGRHQVANWPLRKTVRVYFDGSRAVEVTLDGDNGVRGWGLWYMEKAQAERLRTSAGWDDLGFGLVHWVWGATGGAPVPIDRIR